MEKYVFSRKRKTKAFMRLHVKQQSKCKDCNQLTEVLLAVKNPSGSIKLLVCLGCSKKRFYEKFDIKPKITTTWIKDYIQLKKSIANSSAKVQDK
jgi:hypothetical protein